MSTGLDAEHVESSPRTSSHLRKKSRELTYGGKPEHRFAYVSSRGVETSFL